MLVGRSESLFLLECMQSRPLKRVIHSFAFGDVEKTVHRADEVTFCIVQRINVYGHDEAGAIGPLDDAFHVSNRLPGCQHLRNHRPPDLRSSELKKKRASAEFFVRLPRLWCATPESHCVTIVLKYGAPRVADECRNWQKIENTLRNAQHGA